MARTAWLLAALLLTGGSAAVVTGLLGQQSPPQPPAAGSRLVAVNLPTESASAPEAATADTAAPPTRIVIPAIGVDSALIRLGLAADGTLQVPATGPDYDKAAWFDGSPVPGQPGPAVIEGHVDSAANGPSVFYSLGALHPGDLVEVERPDAHVTFVVQEVRSYPKDAFPTLDVYGNTPDPELRLITCGGDFDRTTHHYRDNIVVSARLAGSSG